MAPRAHSQTHLVGGQRDRALRRRLHPTEAGLLPCQVSWIQSVPKELGPGVKSISSFARPKPLYQSCGTYSDTLILYQLDIMQMAYCDIF